MKKAGFLVLALLAANLFAGSLRAEVRASFDCSKAAATSEKAICADPALAVLDLQLAQNYQAFIAAHPEHAADMRRDQRAWLKDRDFSCGRMKDGKARSSCLSQTYKEQIAQLANKHLVICADPRAQGESQSVTCDAVNSPERQSFTISGHEENSYLLLDSLAVRRGGTPPQLLKLEDAKIFKGGLHNSLREKVIELVDVNFDGFDDIKLWTGISAGPNNGYDYWLFDPKTAQFKSSDLGQKLSGFDIVFDPAARTIRTTARASCCEWESVTYNWAGSQLRTKMIETDRVSPYRIPPLKDKDVEISLCATQIDHYNDREELASNDIGPCEREVLDGDMKRSVFLALLQKNRKGYSIIMKPRGDFSILYDKPVPGYSEP